MKNEPNYKKIYRDLVNTRFPEKKVRCTHLFSKKVLTVIDIIELSQILSSESSEDAFEFNQRHRSYDESAISHILKYQREARLSNLQLAKHFGMSRNTISKWRKNQSLSQVTKENY
ncbi:hypothetical protein MUU74_17750 [Chryseobacterium daecheongense]|uniref:helix-turn-helix domain-containing protein n=1 Tax=Chryseobacterium daecheongense TaxID=192389 RepID=UPI001FD6797B|nr:helix-turn-helix domain-containing protein [Chryseobacterium daecheongense]UOU98322.1 hypothetical protein MUU74_17750 [Chryseobacterium daecheongense]